MFLFTPYQSLCAIFQTSSTILSVEFDKNVYMVIHEFSMRSTSY